MTGLITALPSHIKNGYLEKSILLSTILIGLAGTALSAWMVRRPNTKAAIILIKGLLRPNTGEGDQNHILRKASSYPPF